MSSHPSSHNSLILIRRPRQRQLLRALPRSRSNVTRSSLAKQDRRPPMSSPQAGMNRNGLIDRTWFPATTCPIRFEVRFQAVPVCGRSRRIEGDIDCCSGWLQHLDSQPTSSSIQESIGRSFRVQSPTCLYRCSGWVIRQLSEW